MISRTTKAFRQHLAMLPPEVRRQAVKAFRLWQSDPSHPSIQFKQINATKQIWSARVALGWRALGIRKEDGVIVWFWIGSHADYDRLLGG